jgi:hypothetical protein
MTSIFSAHTDPLLSRKQAARYLTELGLIIAPQTLARKFHEGAGPLCTHLAGRAMYRQSHLDAYFAEQLCFPRKSSSQPRRISKSESANTTSPANGSALSVSIKRTGI